LIDAASHVGVGVPVPLNAEYKNDLAALADRVNPKTRALYLINPHNPTGTVNDDASLKGFLRDVSQRTPVIVDEAYLEYTPDFERWSAVSLVREGANAETLGRLNIAAASTALADRLHVSEGRFAIATERKKWMSVLEDLRLSTTDSHANFIFFEAGHPQELVASAMRDHGIVIGRSFARYANWIRITIGQPVAQQALRALVSKRNH
jgi:histidinol-phosphate aminotransferase